MRVNKPFNGRIPVRFYFSDRGRDHDDEVRRALSEIIGTDVQREQWEIRKEKRGKPYFPDHPNVPFSVTDCEDITAVAFDFGQRRIGIDLQEHKRRRSDSREKLLERCVKIARRAFRVTEQAYVKAGAIADTDEGIRRFFLVWSAKEAYVKYTGDGIDDGFSKMSVLPETFPVRRNGSGNVCLTEENPEEESVRVSISGNYAWHALGQYFFAAELSRAGSAVPMSLCVCAERNKPLLIM